jgi:SOS-response transcriptional repressor LexA
MMAMRASQNTKAGDATRMDILVFVAAYERKHGYGPTHREIGAACYLARSSVRYELSVLARQGRIVLEPGKTRGIRLKEAA